MSNSNISSSQIQIDEDSTWQTFTQKGGTIMPVQSKYWIAVVIYLEYIWFMTFLIIMVITKSL